MARLSLSAIAIEQLRQYRWPGNMRELQTTLQRAAVALPEGAFEIASLDDLPADEPTLSKDADGMDHTVTTLQAAVMAAERKAVIDALAASEGNRSLAARRLGIDRASLYKRLRPWGIPVK